MNKQVIYWGIALVGGYFAWTKVIQPGLARMNASTAAMNAGKPGATAATNPLTGAKTQAQLEAATKAKEQETIQAGIKAGADIAKSLFSIWKPAEE